MFRATRMDIAGRYGQQGQPWSAPQATREQPSGTRPTRAATLSSSAALYAGSVTARAPLCRGKRLAHATLRGAPRRALAGFVRPKRPPCARNSVFSSPVTSPPPRRPPLPRTPPPWRPSPKKERAGAGGPPGEGAGRPQIPVAGGRPDRKNRKCARKSGPAPTSAASVGAPASPCAGRVRSRGLARARPAHRLAGPERPRIPGQPQSEPREAPERCPHCGRPGLCGTG